MDDSDKKIIDGESKLKKNLVRLLLLTACGSVIFGLPYFRWSFYEPFIELYGLTNEQLGMLGSAYGFFGLISYLMGGVLADRFSAKRLIFISLLLTGAGGLVHHFTTSFTVLLALYAVWGLTSLLTFWPALIKAIRLTGGSKEQARVFGIFEGGRGVVNTISESIAIGIFGFIVTSRMVADAVGLRYVILYYSIVTMALGVACIFVLKDEGIDLADEKSKFKWSNVKKAVKLPAVWMVALILCCTYAMNMSYSYFNPYSVHVFGVSTVFAALLTALAQYVRPLAAPTGGFLADRLGRPNMMLVGFIIMAAGTAAIISLPASAGIVALGILCAIVYIAMFMNYGVVLSLMDEGGIPLEISGTAIGIVCTFGYLPEVVVPVVAGRMIDAMEGGEGFRVFFTSIIVVLIVGIGATLMWKRIYGRKKSVVNS